MDDLYFKCEICDQSFEATSDSMLTVEYSSYLITSDLSGEKLELAWEGGGYLYQKPLPPNAIPIKVPIPPELSNIAICICSKCQNLLLPADEK